MRPAKGSDPFFSGLLVVLCRVASMVAEFARIRGLMLARILANSATGHSRTRRLSIFWHDGGNDLAHVLAIDLEIAVDGKDRAWIVQLCHAHKTCVGKGHWHIRIAIQQV